MKIKKVNVSVVVLARDHNPSLLHPAFLSSQNIVPEEWGLEEPPLCTPPFAIVKYDNGIVFSAERSKLQVAQTSPVPRFRDAKVPLLMERYVSTLSLCDCQLSS